MTKRWSQSTFIFIQYSLLHAKLSIYLETLTQITIYLNTVFNKHQNKEEALFIYLLSANEYNQRKNVVNTLTLVLLNLL